MTSLRNERRGLEAARFAHVFALAVCVCANAAAGGEIENVKLSDFSQLNGDVLDFIISPRSDRVIYNDNGVRRLHSVPIDGGLSVALTPESPVRPNIDFTPDGSHIVFLAKQEPSGDTALFQVPAAGPAAATIRLSRPPVSGGNVGSFKISPDGSRVVFRGNLDTDNRVELYSVPVGGPATGGLKISGSMISGGRVTHFQIDPASGRVVYRADQDQDEVFELYSVPIGGPASAGVKLNENPTTGGDVQDDFEISPDGARVAYRAGILAAFQWDVFSVPLAGPASSSVKLNEPLSGARRVDFFGISSDGARVAYVIKHDPVDAAVLHIVPIDGPSNAGVRLSHAVGPFGGLDSLQISPDVSRVVYRAWEGIQGAEEIFSVPIDGPSSDVVKLNDSLTTGREVRAYKISPDSSRVVYFANPEADERFELYSVPIEGPAGGGVKLNLPTGPLGTAGLHYHFSPDGSRVLYGLQHGDLTFSPFELYTVPSDGPSSASVKMSGPMVINGNVDGRYFGFSPDGQRVVYMADQDTNDIDELYVSYEKPAATPQWRGYK